MRKKFKLGIDNEFGELKSVISHDARNIIDISITDWEKSISKEELQIHPESGSINKLLFLEQQKNYREFLQKYNIELISPTTQSNAFCQLFTRDPCFIIKDTTYIGSMRDSIRKLEIAGLSEITKQVEKIVKFDSQDAIIEGGDIIILDEGNVVLVGTGQITNKTGFSLLATQLKLSGVESVIMVPHYALHLDCCIAPLPNKEALISKSHIDNDTIEIIKPYFKTLIPLNNNEAEIHLASNLFWINREEVISTCNVKETNNLLKSKHFNVHEIEFSQPISLWGSVRCAVCPLLRV